MKIILLDGRLISFIIRQNSLIKWSSSGFWNIQKRVINADTIKHLEAKARGKKKSMNLSLPKAIGMESGKAK